MAKGDQIPLTRRIRHDAAIKTGAVDLITEPQYADELVTGGESETIIGEWRAKRGRRDYVLIATKDQRARICVLES